MEIFNYFLGLITAANIVIAVVLRRVARVSFDWRSSEDNDKRDSDSNVLNQPTSSPPLHRRAFGSTATTTDIILATKRRTTTQVTRMLLAVTLSLIVCNIPNTIFFVFIKIYDTRRLLFGRVCENVSDNDILLYKFGFYSGVIQDILSDLPHIFNFFLYCLAGKKFRSIFMNEVHHFLLDLHLIKRGDRRGAYCLKPDVTATGLTSNHNRSLTSKHGGEKRISIDVLFNGQAAKIVSNEEKKNSLRKKTHRHTADETSIHPYVTIQ
jgi:hypothetical protein